MDVVEDLAKAERSDIDKIIGDAVVDHMKAKAPGYLLPDTPLKTQRSLIIRLMDQIIGQAIKASTRVVRLKVVGKHLHILHFYQGGWQKTAEYTANILWYIGRRLDVMACGVRVSRLDQHQIWLFTIRKGLSFTVSSVRTMLVRFEDISYRVIFDNRLPDEILILARADKETV